jgi:LCP family protein required for cell wall assembly
VFLRRSLLVAVCFALGVGLALGALVWQDRHQLIGTQISLDTLGQPPVSEGPSEPQGLSDAQTVLVVGDDSGDDLSKGFRNLGAGEREGHRTDTIMVMRIDPQGGKVTGINFPRDLLVTLCDGSRQRINAAWYVGGPDCLVETVRDFAGLQIDHYVQVNFEGFVRIVDAVGGVEMYLEEPMEDSKAHVDLPKGCVSLDGRDALGFVRSRMDSDFGRIARQQRFLKELADRATSASVLANPVRVFQLVDSVGELLTVDDGLSIGAMREFALTLRGVSSGDISMGTIPTVTDSSTGAYYEIPVESGTREILAAFKRDELAQYLGDAQTDEPQPSESAAPEPKIPVDELSPVTVLNASNINGLAASTAEVLTEAGITVAAVDDADRPEPAGVVISYPPGLLSEAQSLRAAAFPEATLELGDEPETLTVIVDGDHDPDLIDVAGAEQDPRTATPRPTAPPRPEYTNADVDTAQRC